MKMIFQKIDLNTAWRNGRTCEVGSDEMEESFALEVGMYMRISDVRVFAGIVNT